MPVSYYELISVNGYEANRLILNNNAIGEYEKGVAGKAVINKTIYGAANNHIKANVKKHTVHSGTKTITSKSVLKPSIPEENYEALAKSQIEGVSVKSDKLIINNNYVLRDTVCSQNAKAPIYFNPPASNIYIVNIGLNSTARNGVYSTKVKVKYKNTTSNAYITKVRI